MKGNKHEGGTAHTSGHYDTVSNNADLIDLVTHAPIVEDFCHVRWHTDSAVLAWLYKTWGKQVQ